MGRKSLGGSMSPLTCHSHTKEKEDAEQDGKLPAGQQGPPYQGIRQATCSAYICTGQTGSGSDHGQLYINHIL